MTLTEMVNLVMVQIDCWARSKKYPDSDEDLKDGLVDMVGRLHRITKNERRNNYPIPHDKEIICAHILVYLMRYSIKHCSNLGNCVEALVRGTLEIKGKKVNIIEKDLTNVSLSIQPVLSGGTCESKEGANNSATLKYEAQPVIKLDQSTNTTGATHSVFETYINSPTQVSRNSNKKRNRYNKGKKRSR